MLQRLCGRRRALGSESKKCLAIVVVIAFVLVSLLNDTINLIEPGRSARPQNDKHAFKTILSKQTVPTEKRPLKILLWTTFFSHWAWYEESKHVFGTTCRTGCSLTRNKSEIEQADAVIFHLPDITWPEQLKTGFSFSFPRYRRQDQIWILHNLEPYPMIMDSMNGWQGIFNWTWSYTQNSDIHTPYGQFKLLDQDERIRAAQKFKDANPFVNKTENGGIAMISDCTDSARRYRIYEHLRRYINVRVIGKCGEQCPGDYLSCNKLLQPYKFYMAFENSDCDEYVSEKYWRSLQRGQIPIVAWRLSMDGLVIPGSYINVMDFPDLDAAGRYILEVNRNETLYNSYFRWRLTHAEVVFNSWCKVCSMLTRNTRPRMVYHDMHGWIYNHTCKPVTMFQMLRRTWDRFTYDFRIS